MRADLADEGVAAELCAGQHAVVHCAALCVPWPTLWLRSEAHERANVRTTAAVLRGCAQAGGVRLVHVSTPSLYFSADYHAYGASGAGAAQEAGLGGVPEWAARRSASAARAALSPSISAAATPPRSARCAPVSTL